jgi:hypothetical protein
MKKSATLAFVVLLLVGLGTTSALAQAPGWTLGDWSANVNGTVYINPAPLPANVNSSGFNFNTGVGSLVFTVSNTGSKYVGVYLNPFYDSGFGDLSTSYGSVVGTAPLGVTYQLDWPVTTAQTGTIWPNFAGNTLDGSNTVGTYSDPPNACCSVALAEILGFTVGAGTQEVVTFTTSTTQPTGGFYLQVTDNDSGSALYLTETATNNSTSATPEPGSMLLMASGLGMLLAKGRKFFERRNAA